jgi:hypothetical protein
MKKLLYKIKAWRWWKQRQWNRRTRQLCLLVIRIDCAMAKEKWPSWKKRQWWRDIIKHPRARDAAFTQIYKTLGGEVK